MPGDHYCAQPEVRGSISKWAQYLSLFFPHFPSKSIHCKPKTCKLRPADRKQKLFSCSRTTYPHIHTQWPLILHRGKEERGYWEKSWQSEISKDTALIMLAAYWVSHSLHFTLTMPVQHTLAATTSVVKSIGRARAKIGVNSLSGKLKMLLPLLLILSQLFTFLQTNRVSAQKDTSFLASASLVPMNNKIKKKSAAY